MEQCFRNDEKAELTGGWASVGVSRDQFSSLGNDSLKTWKEGN